MTPFATNWQTNATTMKIYCARILTLLFLLSLLSVLGAEPSIDHQQKLQKIVQKIVRSNEDLSVGTSVFDSAVLKNLESIGTRDQIITAIVERSANADVSVDIHSYKSYIVFQWIEEKPYDEKTGGMAFFASVTIQLDEALRPKTVKSSVREEPFEPIPLERAKKAFGK